VQRSKGAVLPCTSAPRRLRSFPLAAEVDANDAWQRAVIGLACVSNSGQQVHRVLMRAIWAKGDWRLDVEVLDYRIELW